MARKATRRFDESDLTKGQVRKLRTLRKSLGDDIANKAMGLDEKEQEDEVLDYWRHLYRLNQDAIDKALGDRLLKLRVKIGDKIDRKKTEGKIRFEPLPADDPLQRKPNIELAKKELKWEPHIQLETGLKQTIDYFRTLQ